MNAERVTLSAEEIRAQLIENGMSPEEAGSCSLDIARKILEGPTVGIDFDTDLDSSGLIVMGALHFHFRIGQEFEPGVIEGSTRTLIASAQRMSEFNRRAPFPLVLEAASEIKYRIVIAPDGRVYQYDAGLGDKVAANEVIS